VTANFAYHARDVAARDPQPPSLTFVLFIWLTPQLITLAISASRVPLSAHPPRPIESVALQQMVIVQIVGAALLAPLLFRCLTSTVAVAITAAPMLQLAAFLSSADWKMGVLEWGSAGPWALILGGSFAIGRGRRNHLVATLATAWSLGGLVLAYLHTEFAAQHSLPAVLLGPAYVGKQVAASQTTSPTFWFFMGTFATLALATAYAARLRRRAAIAS
jgi:hypothetical protein